MAKVIKTRIGVVYSTDPDFQYQNSIESEPETLPAAKQKLIVSLDKKQRAGKQVSLITGFIGKTADLEALAKELKNHCGAGGSAKDGEIVIQGDFRPKINTYLLSKGFKVVVR